MSNKLIDIVNISKAFDENVVLDELNLYIRERIFNSSGTSGCGKATLLRILGGFETPDSGKSSSMVRISRTWLQTNDS